MKRPSPIESATLYKVGIKKIGSDGNKWIIAENKNGIKRWKLYKVKEPKEPKVKEPKESMKESKKTQERTQRTQRAHERIQKTQERAHEIIQKTQKEPMKESKKLKKEPKEPKEPMKESKKLKKEPMKVTEMYDIPKIKQNNWKKWLEPSGQNRIKKSFEKLVSLKPHLKKIGVKMEIIGLPISSGHYFVDWPSDYMREKYPVEWEDDKSAFLMVIIRLDNQHMIERNLTINCQHKGIHRDVKKKFIALMTEQFGKQFQWNGSSTKTINITL